MTEQTLRNLDGKLKALAWRNHVRELIKNPEPVKPFKFKLLEIRMEDAEKIKSFYR